MPLTMTHERFLEIKAEMERRLRTMSANTDASGFGIGILLYLNVPLFGLTIMWYS